MMRILLLEDDGELSDWVRRSLEEAGHVVDALADGREALLAATSREYDVLILDRMTPGLDGLAALRAYRAAGGAARALMLTALTDVDDRVEGLEAGADDYLGKPFAVTELLARVSALGRRGGSEAEAPTKLVCGPVELDLLRRACRREGREIDLNPKEFILLETLMRHPGRVMTRSMLLERVWDIHFDPGTSVVETHVSRLRAKLDKPFDTPFIRTVRGSGYVVDA